MASPADYKLFREIGNDAFSSVMQARTYRMRKCVPLIEPPQN